jgi:hypothetical protein
MKTSTTSLWNGFLKWMEKFFSTDKPYSININPTFNYAWSSKEKTMTRIVVRSLLMVCILSGFAMAPAIAHSGSPNTGAVFVGTNHNNTNAAPDSGEPANQVVMYHRASDGMLSLVGYFDTGGQGSGPSQRFAGDGLGSSHSIQLSQDRRWLFVTNAGSNTVSVFRVMRDGLHLTDVVPTGDSSPSHRFPNSVTQHGKFVYVLNSAGNGSITGFRFNKGRGTLTPIPNSTRELDAIDLRR